uniref:Nicotinate-nucleotide--dimethylbenzimidazole phosphoribosyltransferase n=2 Tax=Candidatus Kentrum eta TaxID=2126337 RepID=A0A450VE79_9GAMM|nr:MAG: nicotinate-nucleotide-dimethylbenzimidazole phosphoribosyltransferase [Candidatus Kentron sp. H]VFK03221.1 MAG: nicotinate-nucleotide-dimethylbenzimidazole phosphoribosyltransferase [Candidatus Kentron sp. H]
MQILNETLSAITPQSEHWRTRARERLDQLTMPHWALGRLMDLAVDLAGITRSLQPPVGHKVIVVMAADHGVVAEGVSQYPQDVTRQMVANFMAGGAGINALAGQAGADVCVVDMGVAQGTEDLARAGAAPAQPTRHPRCPTKSLDPFARNSHIKKLSLPVAPGTANIAKGPAMTRDQAVTALENGIRVAQQMIEEGYDLIGVGEIGIGNTTSSAALIAALCGESAAAVTGHGTGIDDQQRRRKVAVIEAALRVNGLAGALANNRPTTTEEDHPSTAPRAAPDGKDALAVLAKVGGFEIGGIAGVILGTAAEKRPVVMDGLISTTGALVAYHLMPTVADYLIAAHRSVEKGHLIALERLGKEPLLDLRLRLGEGTGAALAMNLVAAAARVLTEVKTFSEAAVSDG